MCGIFLIGLDSKLRRVGATSYCFGNSKKFGKDLRQNRCLISI